jgi:hypothetical protein
VASPDGAVSVAVAPGAGVCVAVETSLFVDVSEAALLLVSVPVAGSAV